MKKVFFLYKVSLAILFLPLVIIVSSPLKLWGEGGGVLVCEIWTKRGVMKKLLRNRGLVEREDTLRKGSFQIVSSVFLKKSMFSLLLEFLSGKYSHLL